MTRLATLMVLVSLSACTGSLLETKLPVPTVYVLAAAPANAAASAVLPADLAIAVPTAAPGLDTDRIAVLHETRRLDFYREAQWGTALPQVVQALVVGTFQNQKVFRSVTTEQGRTSPSYLLDLDVRDFQAEYANDGEAPTVHVTLVGSLIRVHDRKLIGVLPSTSNVRADANRLNAVVEAFESAARQAALALVKQTTDTISANGS